MSNIKISQVQFKIMKNIISLLWQYRSLNIPITPTILKNAQENPRLYFYSQRQKLVLRKKSNPNHDAVTQIQHHIQQISNHKQSDSNFIVRIDRDGDMQIKLRIVNIGEMVKQLGDHNFEGQYSLVEGCSSIIRVKFEYYGLQVVGLELVDSFPEIGHRQPNHLLKLQTYCCFFSQQYLSSLQTKIQMNYQQLVSRFNVKADIILGMPTSNTGAQIKMLDAITLNILQKSAIVESIWVISPNFYYQCGHKLKCQPPHKQRSDQLKQPQQTNFKKQDIKIECEGCKNKVEPNTIKEIQVDTLRQIRKKNNLSIRGLTKQFYEVCQQCYLFEN